MDVLLGTSEATKRPTDGSASKGILPPTCSPCEGKGGIFSSLLTSSLWYLSEEEFALRTASEGSSHPATEDMFEAPPTEVRGEEELITPKAPWRLKAKAALCVTKEASPKS